MNFNRRNRPLNITAVSGPKRIIRDGRGTSAASSTAPFVRNPSMAPQSLKAALQEVTAQITSVEDEETIDSFDCIDDISVSEERPASRIQPTQYTLSAGWRIQYANRSRVFPPL